MLIQAIAIVGSLAILGAYAAGQFRWLETTSLLYAVLNFVGSGILAVVAVLEQQWGFLLLEGVWAIISLWAIFKLVRSRERTPR